jgi:hypothetical protein
MTEYEIPTGPLSTALYLSEGQDGKIWFVEWASNRVAYLDTSVVIPFDLRPKGIRSITLGASESKSIDTIILPQPTANGSSSVGKSPEIELGLTGMTESGLQGVFFTANPSKIELPNGADGSDSPAPTIEPTIEIKTLGNAKPGNYSVMVQASTQENDGLVISKLYPFALVLDLPQSANANNQGQPTTITSGQAGQGLSVRETIQILALATAAGLIGYIVYRRVSKRKTAATSG